MVVVDSRRPVPGKVRLTGRMEWILGRPDTPDLMYAVDLVNARHPDWDLWVPSIELVRCGQAVKPAVFLKVGQYEYNTWSERVVLEAMRWEWHPPKPCVVFRMSMFFRDPQGGRLGVGARGQITNTTVELDRYSHQLVCAALFDPTLRDHTDRITALAQAPGPLVVFFVEEFGAGMNYIYCGGVTDGALGQLQVASHEAAKLPSPDRAAFAQACAAAAADQPTKNWWS
ncbi:hypothetical protein AAH979_00225 [Plantactinospora sp. ZYX-F-223]|uniref:hypothetical protein n=1 Tax=Plantactinospora sp. ZYX-F-223 TaxID=3144103 RepID=UPI0031FD8C17